MGKGEGVLSKDGTGSEPAPITEATLPRELTEAIQSWAIKEVMVSCNKEPSV